MKKAKAFGYLALTIGALTLASCQIAPVNASTSITSTKGAGNKTIYLLALVDGSCQMEKTEFTGNNDYYVIDNIDMTNIQLTPKANGDKVKLFKDGYLTNPNKKATCQEVWTEFNQVVESYVPEGFDFSCRSVQSSDWNDDYMENVPGTDVNAWKGYVYSVSYSWKDTQDYINKTKTLIGEDVYSQSQLKELDDANTPWASLTKESDGSYTWSEAYLVNYWSVYGIADKVLSSEYFNKAALGSDYAITTDQAFCTSLQEYKIGESEKMVVSIDNKNGLDENLNPKFISAKGIIKEEKKNNVGLYIGIGVAAVVVIGAVVCISVTKKNKKA